VQALFVHDLQCALGHLRHATFIVGKYSEC
jgi:hypothetical protein